MRRLIEICALAVLILAVGRAQADIINGSFDETPLLTGWNSYTPDGGLIAVVGSHGPLAPRIRSGDSAVPADPRVTSWGPTDGPYFVTLRVDGPGNWTQLYQSFTAPAGYELTFDYFWGSQDYMPYNDVATGELLSGVGVGGTVVETLFSESVASDPGSFYGTPWESVNYTIPITGTYTLLFQVANNGDDENHSFIGIDNVATRRIPAIDAKDLLIDRPLGDASQRYDGRVRSWCNQRQRKNAFRIAVDTLLALAYFNTCTRKASSLSADGSTSSFAIIGFRSSKSFCKAVITRLFRFSSGVIVTGSIPCTLRDRVLVNI